MSKCSHRWRQEICHANAPIARRPARTFGVIAVGEEVLSEINGGLIPITAYEAVNACSNRIGVAREGHLAQCHQAPRMCFPNDCIELVRPHIQADQQTSVAL